MTVHAIQVVTATEQQQNPETVPEPAPPSIPTVLPDRVDQAKSGFQERLPEQAQAVEEIPDPPHMRCLYRFDESEDLASIVGSIEQKLADLQWYEIRFHQCAHDESERKPCPGWKAERSFGSIPGEV